MQKRVYWTEEDTARPNTNITAGCATQGNILANQKPAADKSTVCQDYANNVGSQADSGFGLSRTPPRYTRLYNP